MDPVVSLIVPAYNSEKYILEAFSSFAAQDFREPYEVIAVIDPSTDKTAEMAENFAKTHPNFKIILNEPKLGLGKSRLKAISKAKGEYVAFADADDVLSTCALRTFVEAMRKTGADCVNCSFKILHSKSDGTEVKRSNPFVLQKTLTREQAVGEYLADRRIRGFLWTKIYKRSVLNSRPILVLNEPTDMFEDVAINFTFICHCQRVAVIKDALYYYRKGVPGSNTTIKRTDRAIRHLIVFAMMRLFLEKFTTKKLLNIYYKHLDAMSLSLLFDEMLDKRAGGDAAANKKLVSEQFKFLKAKGKPLPIQGTVWEETSNRCFLF
ncbi:MAG: glycosyltransferase [Bacilli bacterium]|jgi:glycosyltransferase involved in cell wall biosynthesis|nr:glycosyltransferase [Bacilli bacterium]